VDSTAVWGAAEHVEDALDEAEAARAYAEQMVEAAHAAQAEAVEAARRAAILHATEASRKEKERLLAEAHEHAEKEMEAARIRAMEIIATAEAVGAQRVAAATNSVHSVFDEEHPHLSETHPVLDGSGSPVRSRSSAAAAPEAGSPANLQALQKTAGRLPDVEELERMSKLASERVRDMSSEHISQHQGCVFVTIHDAEDLKDMEVFGKMSPYVTLTVTGALDVKRTATHHKGGKTPVWDEAFVFPIDSDADDQEVRALACHRRGSLQPLTALCARVRRSS